MARARPRGLVHRIWLLPAVALGLGIGLYVGTLSDPDYRPQPSAAEIVQQTGDPSKQAYLNQQQKAEIDLLTAVLKDAYEVIHHHRHHSEVMWDLLEGKITSNEAWWRGGDSTCAGWLAANRAEIELGRLQGKEVKPEPLPKRGEAFCKAARERK